MEKLYTTMAISLLYLALMYIQSNILSFLYVNTNTALVNLPAAVAMMASLIEPRYSAIGIFIGGFFSIHFFFPSADILTAALEASFPAIACTITVLFITLFISRLRSITSPNADLSELTTFDVMSASIVYAVTTNILFTTYVVGYLGEQLSFKLFALRIFGDFTGSFLVFVGLNVSYIIYKNIRGSLFKGPG